MACHPCAILEDRGYRVLGLFAHTPSGNIPRRALQAREQGLPEGDLQTLEE
jgi:hypothetical protein